MKLLISLLVILSFSSAMADCDQSVTYLTIGSKTECDGYLFTKDAEATNRQKLDLGESYKQLSDLKDQKINILDQRIEVYQKAYNDSLAQQSNQNLEKWLYFGLGLVAAYTAIRLGSQVNNH
jgi:hypothetical protein